MVAVAPKTAQVHKSFREKFSPDEFVVLRSVPVFAEHETTAKDGRQLRFGRDELQAIVDRCNRRIQETGDYAAVTIGHTPDPQEARKGAPQPEMVGYAGPFRLSTIGPPGKERYAIEADFAIYREDYPKIKKHPRRSPEVWLEDSYEEMFLDPIALLGAEAPRLDMGLLYSASRGDKVIEKYTAVAPGPANTFIPGTDSADETRRYESNADTSEPGANAMDNQISPDLIRQIVEALDALPWVQFAKAQMAENQNTGTEEGAIEGTEAPPAEPPAAPPSAPPADTEKEMRGRYEADDETEDDKMKDSADNCDTKDYAAEGEVDGTDQVQEASVDKEGEGDAAGGYQKTGEPAKLSRGNSWQQAVDQLQLKCSRLEEQLKNERIEKQDAERYRRLTELVNGGYRIDPDKQIERMKCAKMSAEQFAEEIQFIEEHCEHLPLNMTLPTSMYAPSTNGTSEKYARETADRAREICEERAAKGETPDYENVLKELRAGTSK